MNKKDFLRTKFCKAQSLFILRLTRETFSKLTYQCTEKCWQVHGKRWEGWVQGYYWPWAQDWDYSCPWQECKGILSSFGGPVSAQNNNLVSEFLRRRQRKEGMWRDPPVDQHTLLCHGRSLNSTSQATASASTCLMGLQYPCFLIPLRKLKVSLSLYIVWLLLRCNSCKSESWRMRGAVEINVGGVQFTVIAWQEDDFARLAR